MSTKPKLNLSAEALCAIHLPISSSSSFTTPSYMCFAPAEQTLVEFPNVSYFQKFSLTWNVLTFLQKSVQSIYLLECTAWLPLPTPFLTSYQMELDVSPSSFHNTCARWKLQGNRYWYNKDTSKHENSNYLWNSEFTIAGNIIGKSFPVNTMKFELDDLMSPSNFKNIHKHKVDFLRSNV